jgi:hypothetical protein
LVEDPVSFVVRGRLVAAVQAGANRGPQVPAERRIDGGDAIDRGGDRLGGGDPCAFVAGAGYPCPSAEAGRGGQLANERVAFGVQGVEPTDVGPILGLGEIAFDVAQPSAVRLARLVVEHVA